jgi:hypothetical protein
MTLGFKVALDGWFGPDELPVEDAELDDVYLDHRGRLRGSWKPRNDKER